MQYFWVSRPMLATLDELDNMEDKTHTKTDHNIVNKVWVRSQILV